MSSHSTDASAMPSIDAPWALGHEKFDIILKLLASHGVTSFLEFGSGVSTLHFSRQLPDVSLTTVESKPEFLATTRGYVEQFGNSNVDLVEAPLIWRRDGIRAFYTYGLPAMEDGRFDAVLVDGPVEAETVRGREGALYACFEALKVGSIIFLDDYHRSGSKRIVRNWMATYGDALELLPSEHEDLAILQKKSASTAKAIPGASALLDNYVSSGIVLARAVRRLLTG